ncbi:MAG: hypothetical protein ACOX3V_06115 [Bacillota bacterium]|jgi:hypothetical protein
MTRRIDVEVSRGGRVKMEFSGFPGEECFAEAEVLQNALRELGLWALPVTITPKTTREIESELPRKTAEKQKVPVS